MHFVSQTGSNSIGTGIISNPWATVSYAASHVSTSGHIIHILPGTISESSAFTLASGVSLEGEGIASIISSTYASSFTINLSGNQSVHDLKMDGNNITAYGAMKASGVKNNIKIYNNTIINFNYFGISLENGNSSTPPATFATGNEVHDNIITNCSGYYGGNRGCLEIDGQDGLLIYNNTINADRGGANSGDCIYAVEGQLKNVKIYNNDFTKTYYPGISNWDFALELWNLLQGNEIYENDIIGSIDITRAQGKGTGQYCVWIHDNNIGQLAPHASESTRGIDLESYNHMNDIIIERNYIHDVNIGVGNNLEYTNNDENNVRISYNVFNNITGSGGNRGWGIYYGYPPNRAAGVVISNISILNNVFIGGASGTWGIHLPDCGTATNVRVDNNIIEGFSIAVHGEGTPYSTTIDTLSIEKNIFYSNNTNGVTYTGGLSPTNNTTQNNLTSNPTFVSSSDFHLLPGSPAIGSGLDIGLTGTLDIGGVMISSPPEIGAYEFAGIAVSPSPTRPITTMSPTLTPTRSRMVIALSSTPTPTITPTKTPTTSQPLMPSSTPSRTPSLSLTKTPTASQPLIPLSPSLTPSLTPSRTPTRSLVPVPTPTTSPLVGSVYYIDGQNGSDSNNGSSGSPFKTLHYAAAHVSSPSTIYINSGTVTETAQTTLPTGVNINGAGVTSIINSTYSGSHTILLSSGSLNTNGNQKISNIRMVGNNTGTGSSGALSAIGIINRGNVTISNVTFDNFYYYAVYLLNGNDDVLPPATFASGNKIIDCTMNNCSAYIGVYSSGDSKGSINVGGQDGLVISGNTISVNRPDGLNGNCIDGVEGHIKNVKIYNNTLTKVFTPSYTWDFAIEFWNLYCGNEIYNNYITGSVDICRAWGKNNSVGSGQYCVWIHDNVIGQDSLKYNADSVHGVLFENTHADCIVEKNLIQNTTETIFINLGYANGQNAAENRFETSNNHEDNLRISYNIIYNTGSLTSSKGWGIYYSPEDTVDRQNTTITNVQIVNNVLVGASGSMWGIEVPDAGNATNGLIKNNIITGFGYAGIYANGTAGTNITTLNITKNILYNNGNSNALRFTNGFAPSLYTYDAPIVSNPLFISSTNFHLQSTSSPAYQAGTIVTSPLLLPMTTDKDGATIANPPEIGAYQLGPIPSSTPTRTITPTPSRSILVISPSVTPTITPTKTRTPVVTPSISISPTPSLTIGVSRTPSKTPTPSSVSSGTILVEGLSRTCVDTGTAICYSYTENVGAPANFIFRNNQINAVNTGGYVVQLGDDGAGSTNQWLNGEIVTGNKVVWGGGAFGSSITHGFIVGYEKNAVVKYNYIQDAPYTIIFKSGDGTPAGNYLTNASGGSSYNIVKNGRFHARVKGINGVKFCNNTFYTGDGQVWYMALISPNTDYSLTVGATDTKFFNNIFYSESTAVMIRIYDNCRVTGFESDYNIFYCASGSPLFEIGNEVDGFTQITFAQWQALGYDAHSRINVNPNFIDKVNFVPAARLDYGLNLNTKFGGTEFQTGLSISATWTLGVSPSTTDQNGAWQVGARVYPFNDTIYYVSASGNDANNGTTQGTSWQTISKVNSYFSNFPTGSQILFNRGDTFYGEIIISKSGTSGNPITIGAYGTGANPIITGFKTISSWTSEGSSIYSSIITSDAQTRMVTVDGVNVRMGRYPDTTYLIFESSVTNTSITDADLAATPNWAGAEVVIKKNNWTIDRGAITNHNGHVISYTDLLTTQNATPNYGYFIQNDLRTVTITNEWYHNTVTGKFYIYGNPASKTVKVATIQSLLYNNGYDYIIIDGLSFEGSIGDAILFASGSNYCNIQNCSVAFAAGVGIKSSGSYGIIDNNSISDCAGAAIMLPQAGSNNNVINNDITNIGNIVGQSMEPGGYEGIIVWANNCLIQNNNLLNIGYTAIDIAPTALTTTIKNNLIDNISYVLDDGGGIYLSSSRTSVLIDSNIVLNVIGSIDGTPNTISLAVGIYLDELAAFITVTNNTVAHGPIGILLHKAHDNIVSNNKTFDNNSGMYYSNWETTSFLYNNTISGNQFVAKGASQRVQSFGRSIADDILHFGTSNNNYFARPVDDNSDFYINYNYGGHPEEFLTLLQWQTLTSQDANSHKSPVAVGSSNNILFYYNELSTNKVVTLPAGNYVDILNVAYSGSVTLLPWKSLILLPA